MIRGKCIHPELLRALAAAGHGSRVLIADANYPAHVYSHEGATVIHVGLRPGLPTATDVLEVVGELIPLEGACAIQPEEGPEPVVYEAFRSLLPTGIELEKVGRYEFYARAAERRTEVVISTGEGRLFGNILLTVGVVSPPGE